MNKILLIIVFFFFNINSSVAAKLKNISIIKDEDNNLMKVCVASKTGINFFTNNKQITIDLENTQVSKSMLKTFQATNQKLVKDIKAEQIFNIARISINLDKSVKIGNFMLDNKCLTVVLNKNQNTGLLESLKDENKPWIAFKPNNESKNSNHHKIHNPLKVIASKLPKIINQETEKSSLDLASEGTVPTIDDYKFENKISGRPYKIVSINSQEKAQLSKNYAVINEKRQAPKREIVVVIDPAHGGKDTGHISITGGIKEKDLVFKYANDLKQILEKNSNYKVLITRNSDEFKNINQRNDFIKNSCANIVISLHADYDNDLNLNGVSFYTFSDRASDNRSEKLASEKNKFYSSKKVKFKQELIAHTISSGTKNSSQKLAETIMKTIANDKNIKVNKNIKSANLQILRNSGAASVLLELGFLSNPFDEKLLLSNDYMKKINQSIAKSINEFFKSDVHL